MLGRLGSRSAQKFYPDFPYPSFPFTTISRMRQVSDGVVVTGFGASVHDVAATDSPYGLATALQYVTRSDGGATTISGASLSQGVDITGNGSGGSIRMAWKPVSGYANNNAAMTTFELRLYSTGNPNSPGANYHARNIQFELASFSTGGASSSGRWQFEGIPVSKFSAVGTGADLTNVKYAMINSQKAGASSGSTINFGNIDFVPNPRTKAALIFRIDDAVPSAYTKAFPALAAVGKAGMLMPGAVFTAGFDTNGKMTSAQLREMLAAGWRLCSQSYSTEDNTIVDAWTSAQRLQEYINTRNYTKKFDQYRSSAHGSYYSNVGPGDMIAWPELNASFQTLHAFLNGNPTNPPLPQCETFPFGDPKFIKCLNVAQDGGGGGVNTWQFLQNAIDDAIACKGVIIAAMHDDWGTNSNVETACNNAIAYAGSNSSVLEIVNSTRDLLAPYNGDTLLH
jgi:hypothetical protein